MTSTQHVTIVIRSPSGKPIGHREIMRTVRPIPEALHHYGEYDRDLFPGYDQYVMWNRRHVPVRPNGRTHWWGEYDNAVHYNAW